MAERKPVTTEEAKGAATTTCHDEMEDIHQELSKIDGGDIFDVHNKKMAALTVRKQSIQPQTRHFLEITERREKEHTKFMKYVIPMVEELQDRDHRLGPGHPHDHSKDSLFFFSAASFFDGKCTSPEAAKLKDEELARHYVMEPHHPEWEKFHDGQECNREDIIEMAVDRLARNVQYGNGKVNMEVMRKFVPKFPLGNQKIKENIFLAFVEKYQKLVEDKFVEFDRWDQIE